MNPDLMRRPRTGPSLWTGLFVILSVILVAEATPQLTYHRPAQRGKNWCAFIVNKNVSCTVIEGTESFIQPQYRCAWNQIHCQPTLAYKVNFRPRYVTSYKVVTELEWRCCPGFRGVDCKEGPADKAKQIAVQTPRPSGEKKETEPNEQQKALNTKRDYQELNEAQEKKIQTLEEEMLRLTHTVIDLQTSLSGVNENLRITVQEDASKFLNAWLNNLAPTASATGGNTEYFVPGLSGSTEREDGLKDVISELTSAREELRNKTDQIDELTRKINTYEERLIEFEELTRGPTATMSSVNVNQMYLDDKLEALRNEMLEGLDRKMADLKNSCEYKLNNVQTQCEETESCLEVKELVLEKESELRKEVNKLRSEMHPAAPGNSSNADYDTRMKNLEQKVEKIAEAHRVLNVRLDNEVELLNAHKPDQSWNDRYNELEFRINITEKNAEVHCFYIEDTLRGLINNSVEDMSNLIDLRLQLLENSQTNTRITPDPSSSLLNTVLHDVDELKDTVQRLDNELKSVLLGKDGYLSNTDGHHNNYQVLVETQLGNSLFLKSLTDTVNEKFELLQNKTLDMEALQMELGIIRFDLYKIEDNVVLLNDSLNSFKRQLGEVNSTVGNTQKGLSAKVDVVQKLFTTTSDTSANGKCCNNLQDKFDILKREVTADKGKCTDNSQGIQTEISKVDTRVSKLENVCGKLDTISGSLQRIKDGLNKHVTSLWNCIHSINGTIKSHSNDIYGLKNSVQVFQTQLTKITTDLQDLVKSRPGAGTEPKQTPQINIIPQLLPRATEKPPHQAPQQPINPQVPLVPSVPKQPAQPQEPQDPTYTKPKSPPLKPVPPTSSGSIVIPLIPGRNGYILEQGQAGPPGRMIKFGSGRQQGVDGQQDMQMSKGFAGAPGYPKPTTDTKDHITITTFSESKGETVTTAQISFSAGFNEPPNLFEVGLIPFNSVLVNDGEHYNPITGLVHKPTAWNARASIQDSRLLYFCHISSSNKCQILYKSVRQEAGNSIVAKSMLRLMELSGFKDRRIFTAPIEGRYMITAVLTPEQEYYVEAVLSVSNFSVARLDTSGYRRELLEYHKPSSKRPVCSGVGTFNLILPLKAGDEVSIVLTGGKLANSDSDEMYSTFSGVLLYPYVSLR